MKIQNFISPSYWTDMRPDYFSDSAEKTFIAILALFLLCSITVLILKRKGGFYKKTFAMLYSFFSGNFVIGIILFFLRFELVPFLSARFWFGLWIISMAIWLFFIVKKLKEVPEKIKIAEIEKEKNKYIP